MRGMNITQQAKPSNILPPLDITGGAESVRFSMKNFAHASLMVNIGAAAAAFTAITVRAAEDSAGTNEEAIPFDYFSAPTDSDVFSSKLTADATGIAGTADDNVTHMVELQADQLPQDKPWVSIEITNGANAIMAGVSAILTGQRYKGDESETAR